MVNKKLNSQERMGRTSREREDFGKRRGRVASETRNKSDIQHGRGKKRSGIT